MRENGSQHGSDLKQPGSARMIQSEEMSEKTRIITSGRVDFTDGRLQVSGDAGAVICVVAGGCLDENGAGNKAGNDSGKSG